MTLQSREKDLVDALQAALAESEALSLGFVSIKLAEAIDHFRLAMGQNAIRSDDVCTQGKQAK